MKLKILLALLLVTASIGPASAGFFGDIADFVTNSQEHRGFLAPHTDDTASHTEATQEAIRTNERVMYRVNQANSLENIDQISAEMDRAGYNAIFVTVEDTGENFYIVKDQGVLNRYDGSVDARITVNSADVNYCLDRLEDGNIGFKDRLEITSRIKNNVEYSKTEFSTFNLCFGGIL